MRARMCGSRSGGGPPVRAGRRHPAAAGRRREAFDAHFRAAEAMSEYRIDEQVEHWAAQLDALAEDDARRAATACLHVALLVEKRASPTRAVAAQALALARDAGAADIEVELLWDLTALDWGAPRTGGAARHGEAALRRLADVVPGTARLDLRDTHFAAARAGRDPRLLGRYAEGDRRLEEAIVVASQRRGHALERSASPPRWPATPSSGRWRAGAALGGTGAGRRRPRRHLCQHALQHAGHLRGHPRLLRRPGGGAGRQWNAPWPLNVRAGWCAATWRRWRQAAPLRTRPPRPGAQGLADAGRGDLHGPERLRVRAALLGAGEPLPAQAVLDEIVAIDDMPLRAALLCVAQPAVRRRPSCRCWR